MTTATRSVAVVATRLPTIDRRALSQAWFSALHLAGPPARAAPARRTSTLPPGVPARPSGIAAGAIHPTVAARVARPAAGSGGVPRGAVSPERRAPSGELARRIERALVRHGAERPLPTAAIAINTGDGRVQLLLRTDGATTRIVALCAPHLRARVDRALAQARFALAVSGTRLEVTE